MAFVVTSSEELQRGGVLVVASSHLGVRRHHLLCLPPPTESRIASLALTPAQLRLHSFVIHYFFSLNNKKTFQPKLNPCFRVTVESNKRMELKNGKQGYFGDIEVTRDGDWERKRDMVTGIERYRGWERWSLWEMGEIERWRSREMREWEIERKSLDILTIGSAFINGRD